MMELGLNGRKVSKDIGMVEFKVIDHQSLRAIVHKLRALVEKRTVVFIGLDNEKGAVTHACLG